MAKKFPALYATPLPSNPLPDSWVITPTKAEYTPALGAEILKAHYPGVDDVRWGSKTAHRVLTIAEVIWVVFLVAVVLLVTASTLLIANTIRLSIFARRREIEVMKLVGATNWFIRGPFMLEGLICGLGGSILAVVLLIIGKELALGSILPHIGRRHRRARAPVRAERAGPDRRRAPPRSRRVRADASPFPAGVAHRGLRCP